MTDHPRFERVIGEPDKAHLNYNGGRMVDCVLRLIDWWLMRPPRRPLSAQPNPRRQITSFGYAELSF